LSSKNDFRLLDDVLPFLHVAPDPVCHLEREGAEVNELEYAVKDGIATARLNRPAKKNALSEGTSLELVSSHMAVVQSTDDYRESIQAYQEKRDARWPIKVEPD